jgi:hypothetical protein
MSKDDEKTPEDLFFEKLDQEEKERKKREDFDEDHDPEYDEDNIIDMMYPDDRDEWDNE